MKRLLVLAVLVLSVVGVGAAGVDKYGKEAFEEEIQLVVRLHDQYACTGKPALA